MDKKLCYIFGTVFIIASGVIYSLERFIAYFSWIGQMNARTGSFPAYPELPGLLTNIFIPIFAVIGIMLFVIGYKESNSLYYNFCVSVVGCLRQRRPWRCLSHGA